MGVGAGFNTEAKRKGEKEKKEGGGRGETGK